MALRGLQAPKPKESSGIGSVVGTILGGIAGVAAAPFTGGLSLATLAPAALGAAGGMATGSSLGSAAEKFVTPAEKEIKQTPQMDVMQRRQQQIEQSPLGQLAQAHQASLELPPDLQEQVQAPLKLAMQRAREAGAPKYGS
jgi:outer membrane lipoprotein SlyB